jgi:hypothetical protein
MSVARVVSFIIWVAIGIWAISSRTRVDTSSIGLYVAVGLFVALGVVLLITILRERRAKFRAGVLRKF